MAKNIYKLSSENNLEFFNNIECENQVIQEEESTPNPNSNLNPNSNPSPNNPIQIDKMVKLSMNQVMKPEIFKKLLDSVKLNDHAKTPDMFIKKLQFVLKN